jgi:hypothetical protein
LNLLVPRPGFEAGSVRVVSAFYPEAEFRSYAATAATYLAPKLLIVAVYCPRDGREAPVEKDGDTQQQLFAA